MTRRGRLAPSPAIVARMSGLAARRRALSPAPFLIFSRASSSARQSATAAAKMAMSAGSASTTASSICRAVSILTTRTPLGIGQRDGAGHQRHLGAERGGGSRERMALLAGGAVGEIAHGIERLMGRAGGDEHAAAWRAARSHARASSGSMAARIACGSAMRPGPYSPQAISPSSGPTKLTPSPRSVATLRRVAGCKPHAHIHGRRDEHALVGGEQHGRWRDRRPSHGPSWP